MRREQGLKAFTVLSCDNVRENGHVAKAAVLGLATTRDPRLAEWIAAHVTFPCTMVDRIVPAATDETLAHIAGQLGVYDPCAIACEPFRQWVIEDDFVNGRPDWDRVGAYLGYLGGYETIADTMTNPAYRDAALTLMLDEQSPTLSMPEGTDLAGYAELLIARFTNPSLKHRTWQIAMDGSQKLPQRLLDPIRLHLKKGEDARHLMLGVAGWMRYISGVDEQGHPIEVIDPLSAQYQAIYQQYPSIEERVRALLAIDTIFGRDLCENTDFIERVTAACQQLHSVGARAAVAALSQ